LTRNFNNREFLAEENFLSFEASEQDFGFMDVACRDLEEILIQNDQVGGFSDRCLVHTP